MDVTEPVIPLGGVDIIGTQGSFYVAVNGRLGEDPLRSMNLTSERGFE